MVCWLSWVCVSFFVVVSLLASEDFDDDFQEKKEEKKKNTVVANSYTGLITDLAFIKQDCNNKR